MPELPEVETIRRGLEPILKGRRLERVIIRDPRLTRPEPPAAIAARLEGDLVSAVLRRGKYLVLELESGRHLLVHLRMTGSFSRKGDAYQRAVVSLDDGSDIVYRDVRRFGTWLLLGPEELEQYFAGRLGPEPFAEGFTPGVLGENLAGRTTPIKTALLDQRTVAGLGNIYADEALWQARVHPLRPAGEVTPREIEALRLAIQEVLGRAIDRGGASLGDETYRDPAGRRGSMQDEFSVYGREGFLCPECDKPIEKARVAGRGTWFCPACQVRRLP